MATLHSQESVFSRRHTPTWLMLAFAAGVVNAVAFFASARFVSHVTGTLAQVGIDGSSALLVLDGIVVLACFVVGAMSSSALLEGRHVRGKRPLHAVPLVAVSALLVGVALLGTWGSFGPFGGAIESGRDFAMLSVLAFAMGLQNAAVATSTGLLVRTTHMTGPATDLGIHLGTALYAKGDARRNAARHAALRAGKIGAFAVGAAVGAALAPPLRYLAFLVPAGIVLVATILSFQRVVPNATLRHGARTG